MFYYWCGFLSFACWVMVVKILKSEMAQSLLTIITCLGPFQRLNHRHFDIALGLCVDLIEQIIDTDRGVCMSLMIMNIQLK